MFIQRLLHKCLQELYLYIPNHPSTYRWINKLRDIHKMKYYSTATTERTWVNLKITILSEKKLDKKEKQLFGSTQIKFQKLKLIDNDRKQTSGSLGIREGSREGYKKARGNSWGDGCSHYLSCGDGVLGVYTCQNLINCAI